ncbi:hypothetical protein [Thermoactinospora rubra]|uniref:hypothetical protein n=1 Tax=Thermoactinospora rubra TaxID=1088767 RepID=UPI000A110F66|nr:hypothetical protein [Thermoactinospora rubra]
MPGHRREAGTVPRPLAVLAGLALAGATAVAVWMLPTRAVEEPAVVASPETAAPSAGPAPAATPTRKAPGTFVAYVDIARDDRPSGGPGHGGQWYLVGHVVAGPDGCTPGWAGRRAPGSAAGVIRRLREQGGDVMAAFGGSAGRDLAARCADPERLAQAYRQVLTAYDLGHAAFEIAAADPGTTARRARAIRALQRETAARGDRLRVTFTFPLTALPPAQMASVLRTTREAGAIVDTVNLLAPIEPQSAPAGRMRRLAIALRDAHAAIARAQGLADPMDAWRRLAITAVLSSPADLSPLDARKLAAFASRRDVAWLSLRGATPRPDVTAALRRPDPAPSTG